MNHGTRLSSILVTSLLLLASADAQSVLRKGLTARVSPEPNQGDFLYLDAQSDPISGDTPVDESLPVLCMLDVYKSWAPGVFVQLFATPPIPGYMLTLPGSRSGWLVDAFCKNTFGESWEMVAFDGPIGGRTFSWGGSVDYGSRYWLGQLDQAANPWNSPGDLPAGVSDHWKYCAPEGAICDFVGTKTVYFGMGEYFSIRTLTDGASCLTSVFGNPNPWAPTKACWVDDSPPPPPPSLSVACSSYASQASCRAIIANDDASAYDYAWLGSPPIPGQTGAWVGGWCQPGSGFARVDATHRSTGTRLAAMTSFQCW